MDKRIIKLEDVVIQMKIMDMNFLNKIFIGYSNQNIFTYEWYPNVQVNVRCTFFDRATWLGSLKIGFKGLLLSKVICIGVVFKLVVHLSAMTLGVGLSRFDQIFASCTIYPLEMNHI